MSTMTAKASKASKKAANVAAYEARCKALRALQAEAKPFRKLGFAGTDTQVIEAGLAAHKRQMIEDHLGHQEYGWHLTRWLAGREKTRSPEQVLLLIARFLSNFVFRKVA